MGPNSQKLDRRGIYDFLRSEGLIEYDSKVRNEFLVEDNFDKKAYMKYIEKAGISDKLPSERVLTHLRCAVINEKKELVYTNGGALFFRDNAEDSYFRYTQIVCALFKGLGKAKVIDSAHFNGSMLDNIDNAVAFLWKNLRVRHEIKGMQRENVLELPEDALREAITNAACHRDYLEEGANVMVEIYDDRVVIHNPGGLPKGITLNDLGERSVTRNKMVAEMLYRARYIESMGTGIKKMREDMEDAGLEPPMFGSTGFFETVFKRPKLHTLTIEETPKGLPPNLPIGLSDDEIAICKLIYRNNSITLQEIAEQSGFSKSKAHRITTSLTEKKVIMRSGPQKTGLWKFL